MVKVKNQGCIALMREWQTQLDTLRRDQRVPLGLAVFLSLLLLWAVINFITVFFHSEPKAAAVQTVSVTKHTQNLADLHLFGAYSAIALPVTDLQLTLEGTIVVIDSPLRSQALISSPGQPAEVYHVGESLPGNATVTRIDKDYVVLNDNGALQKLALPIQTVANSQ